MHGGKERIAGCAGDENSRFQSPSWGMLPTTLICGRNVGKGSHDRGGRGRGVLRGAGYERCNVRTGLQRMGRGHLAAALVDRESHELLGVIASHDAAGRGRGVEVELVARHETRLLLAALVPRDGGDCNAEASAAEGPGDGWVLLERREGVWTTLRGKRG